MSPPTYKTASEESPEAAESPGSDTPQDTRRDLTDDALDYASTGWEVFPLTARKAPRFRSPHDPGHGCHGDCGQLGHGFYDATTDADMIMSWSPWKMIGGRIPQHLLVLDVDPHGGGDHTLAKLVRRYGPLPATLTCWSGRGDGGRHLYFLRPPGRLSGARVRPGIDLLHHDLRYAVLPPSPHPATGAPYRWADPDHPPVTLPSWLVSHMRPRIRLTTPTRPRRHGGDSTGLGRWLETSDPTPSSGRHDRVLWSLCRAVEAGASDAVITDIKNAAAAAAAAAALGKPRRDRVDGRLGRHQRCEKELLNGQAEHRPHNLPRLQPTSRSQQEWPLYRLPRRLRRRRPGLRHDLHGSR